MLEIDISSKLDAPTRRLTAAAGADVTNMLVLRMGMSLPFFALAGLGLVASKDKAKA